MKTTTVSILTIIIFLLGAFISQAKGPERSAIEAFIADPFNVSSDLKSINGQIRGCTKLDKEPIANEYHQGQTDTIYTLRKRKSSLGLYKRGGELIFYQADINNRKVKLRDDIKVGMKLDELNEKLPGLRESGDGILSYTNTRGDQLKVYTRRNKVKRIYIERYIE